jgi:hypothetical protein
MQYGVRLGGVGCVRWYMMMGADDMGMSGQHHWWGEKVYMWTESGTKLVDGVVITPLLTSTMVTRNQKLSKRRLYKQVVHSLAHKVPPLVHEQIKLRHHLHPLPTISH